MDKLDPQRRAENMRRIRNKNTGPEVLLRSMLHKQGYRFRLHRKDLPGRPDIVFPTRRKAVFVHGCFWHQHSKCREGRCPASRQEYWRPKLERNRQRDNFALVQLKKLGWEASVVWECELYEHPAAILQQLERFLNRPPK